MQNSPECDSILIDVREPDEFAREHIKGSVNLPLSQFALLAPSILNRVTESSSATFICKSGKRAHMAAAQARQFPQLSGRRFEISEGGIEDWKRKGGPTEGPAMSATLGMPLMRQVQIVAGTLVLTGALLGLLVAKPCVILSAFVGAGLIFAGVSGYCGMAELLAKMPWNKA